jgi:hypothetical protein
MLAWLQIKGELAKDFDSLDFSGFCDEESDVIAFVELFVAVVSRNLTMAGQTSELQQRWVAEKEAHNFGGAPSLSEGTMRELEAEVLRPLDERNPIVYNLASSFLHLESAVVSRHIDKKAENEQKSSG